MHHAPALVAAAVCHRTNALSPQNLRPRTVRLDDAWSVTVYEEKNMAANVEAWMATDEDCVDPFGGVAWPGASWQQENCATTASRTRSCAASAAELGVEALAAASLNASRVIALDYAEDALELCEKGAGNYTCVETCHFDVRHHSIPECDVLVAADVFYSKDLSIACGRACGAALRTKKRPVLISTGLAAYTGHTDAPSKR